MKESEVLISDSFNEIHQKIFQNSVPRSLKIQSIYITRTIQLMLFTENCFLASESYKDINTLKCAKLKKNANVKASGKYCSQCLMKF
jgi:hypothetical protein